MNQTVTGALETLAHGGEGLRENWRFAWPPLMQRAVCRLRLWEGGREDLSLVAVMGGASAGKSTVFNNLLEGHLASRITARGHATRGPILAVHEDQRVLVERLLEEGRLLPGLRRVPVELDANVSGDPDAVVLFYHHLAPLRNVLLFDMPDLTSQAAALEGDVALTLLPWFDRLIVVVDHERWFDRQTVSDLRATSVRFGQDRLVLFNRTREGDLAEEDASALRVQAEHLAAQRMLVLGFRQGRGFCQFAPGTLDDVYTFLNTPRPGRTPVLLRQVANAANRVLNQNTERTVRWAKLRDSLYAAVTRTLPTTWECMTAQMTAEERKQLEVVSRVLRLRETRHWLSNQTHRLQRALKGVPLVGWLVRPLRTPTAPEKEAVDRLASAQGFYESVARRQVHEVQRILKASAFWHELGRWTDLKPTDTHFEWMPAQQQAVELAVAAFESALADWTEKLKNECRGFTPNVHGAIGAGVLALAVVLIAVPGPLTALSLISVKGAIGAALTELIATAGAGALVGKHAKHLVSVIQEKLLGSPEFEAVQNAAALFHTQLEDLGRDLVAAAVDEAAAYVMPEGDPLALSLETIRTHAEATDD